MVSVGCTGMLKPSSASKAGQIFRQISQLLDYLVYVFIALFNKPSRMLSLLMECSMYSFTTNSWLTLSCNSSASFFRSFSCVSKRCGRLPAVHDLFSLQFLLEVCCSVTSCMETMMRKALVSLSRIIEKQSE